MKVIEHFKKASGPYWDNAGPWKLEIITEDEIRNSISFNEGESEDMTFTRDLSDVFSISDLLRAAYEAGRQGETYNYEYIEENQEEDE